METEFNNNNNTNNNSCNNGEIISDNVVDNTNDGYNQHGHNNIGFSGGGGALPTTTLGGSLSRKNSLKGFHYKPRMQGSSFFSSKDKKVTIENYKPLTDCTDDEIQDIFIKKIQQCYIIFDFIDVGTYIREKEIKRSILIELISFISENSIILNKTTYPIILRMIGNNILRILPPSYNSKEFEIDDDNPIYEAAWPHLQSVYDLFLTILELSDFNAKLASQIINFQFISQLLELFDSEDPRERDSLKTVLHRIYGKFVHYRTTIRQMVNNIFIRFTHETEHFCGISELLEIYGSIINGFALPLKEEHKKFLIKVLLPMHKVSTVVDYHGQLSYCVLQFIEKDPTLTLYVVRILIKYWPKVSSQKELLFLGELEEILEGCETDAFETVMEMSYKIIGRCCASPHFQVSERALCFWQNDYILKHFADFSDFLIPIIFGSLYETSTKHWNTTINAIAINVLNIVIDINPNCCAHLAKLYQESIENDPNQNLEYINFMEKFTNLRFE